MSVSVPAMASVCEADGMVRVCAILSVMEGIQRNFTIILATSDITGKHVFQHFCISQFIPVTRQHSLVLTMKLLPLK